MEELIVLGTGNAAATRCYNTCFALRCGAEYLLVDAGGGNGILSILEQQDIPLKHIHHIFVTHAHSDHILGVPWLIRMIGTRINQGKYEGDLTIYCHRELEEAIRTITSLTVQAKVCRHFGSRIRFQIVENGDVLDILGRQSSAASSVPPRLSRQASSVRRPPGSGSPFRATSPARTFCGSTSGTPTGCSTKPSACMRNGGKFKPYEKHHSTVRDACELAEAIGIKNLLLWHTEDKHIRHRKKRYLAEGSPFFSGNLFVPDDGERFSLRK